MDTDSTTTQTAAPPAPSYYAIGLMSGTSLDGIDAAFIITDGERVNGIGPAITEPYTKELREAIQAVMLNPIMPDILAVEHELTVQHAAVVRKLMEVADVEARQIGIIGFHGQTLLHVPDAGLTLQAGNPALLAAATGVNVVGDFRRSDIAYGGQGAPLVPLYHLALAEALPRPAAIVNIGGVANITWLGEGDRILAFDTGPGNAMINDYMLQHLKKEYDKDGVTALSGKASEQVIDAMLEAPYFNRIPPKSLDRNHFADVAEQSFPQDMPHPDVVATLTEFTVASICMAAKHFPAEPKMWIICGGGRHNPAIMQGLRRSINAPIKPCDELGWNGDALEAQAFAYLAVRSVRGMPLTLPSTTGASHPVTGGAFYRASPE